MRSRRAAGLIGAVLIALAVPAPSQAAPITYRTLFQDPGPQFSQDLSLENRAIALTDATPAGGHLTFAFRDFNRQPVADAILRAAARGVLVEGVIDGGERDRAPVKQLKAALGDRLVICGSPGFVFNSCIASSLVPSLQHNKFMTFSRLDDGRENVVLQTSKNFLGPSQLTYYNDMVEIAGDARLYGGYVDFLHKMQSQVRSDDAYDPVSGDDGRNTMFQSPRRGPVDTIVERMDEIDCSGGGMIRAANMAFRSERIAIMHKLVELHDAGCDVDVVFSNADGDIVAGLVSAGIPVHPFFVRSTATRPQVIVHSKFWTVDAKSTVTGTRRKLVYAGSSNWRPDEQLSDDMLLRIADDDVYADYLRYWDLIAGRALSLQNRPASDAVAPSSALTATPGTSSRDDVKLRIAASDGHNVGASGLERLHVELTGAQTGSFDFPGEQDGYNVQELAITAEGDTTVTYFAEDEKGNVEPEHRETITVDRTPPAVTGMPEACELWPPNHKLVHVADVATEPGAALTVTADGDAVVEGGAVWLWAVKGRTYTITATATDPAGNATTRTATCVVPHSRS